MDQAEGLRNVVKMQNRQDGKSARVITITSGKGGVGKSNLAVNLAVAFSNMGKRVIIFDADFGLANVEVMFGTVPKYNLSDMIYGGKSIEDIITAGPLGIGFISGGSGILGLNNLSVEQVHFLVSSLHKLEQLCDVLIVDTGAGISAQVLDFVLASPEVLLVSTPEPSSITDSYSLMKATFKNSEFIKEETKVHLVANKVTSETEGKAVYDKLNSVVHRFLGGEISYLGMIPQDHSLEKAVRTQQIVSLDSPMAKSSRAFSHLAAKLMDVEEDEPQIHGFGITRFFDSFLHRA
ncbi:flagellar biosynthesis protein FlhG [Lachnospiraceae bacterium C10]|jgi:flagellar biosynthesis protein FlhG|nr:MinD/ParA family protein [Lachnospiraceae bacterium]SCW28161.1 flagellar biosynthesis protein FlhG [Lachnospiraceae bacterium C10]SDW00821.1 flagellar biosynthesis protein FlhG [Lachnospiraceae bacterium KHCPX20]